MSIQQQSSSIENPNQSSSIGIYNLVQFSNTTAGNIANTSQEQPQQSKHESTSNLNQNQTNHSQSSSSNHLINPTNHLFLSGLLNSNFYDIQIKCFGRIYKLHRLVLSQVDFFNSLFSGSWNDQSQIENQSTISIRFPNQVNRSSFEYCLTYLYGSPPLLLPPPWAYVSGEPLLLGRTYSLLTRFASKSQPNRLVNLSDEELEWEKVLTSKRTDIQPASPTFLISLLLCSDYLGINQLTNQTIQLIKQTITPFTIIRYLTFADGKSIDDEISELERNVSCFKVDQISQLDLITQSINELQVSRNDSFEFIKESNLNSSELHHDSIEDQKTEEEEINLSHGSLAQQIGQACTSWLSKWSTELLSLEEVLIDQNEDDLLPIGSQESKVLERWPWLKRPELRVWREFGGLSSNWIRVLISSDSLFIGRDILGPVNQFNSDGIGGEWERYGLAKRVVELREKERFRFLKQTDGFENHHHLKILPDPELAKIFEDGIYFSHLTFEQLSFISNDKSSINQQKFVTSKSLQRAHWLSTEFERKLGTTHHLTKSIQELNEDDLPVYLIPEDRTSKLDELKIPTQLTDSFYFGLGRDIITCLPIPIDMKSDRLVTRFEPKRFSTEFINLSRLKDRGRLYSLPTNSSTNSSSSNTIGYAGSKFSCYLQRVRQGSLFEPQLGVYLHRLSEGIQIESSNQINHENDLSERMNRSIQLQPSVGTHSLFGEGSRLRSALGPRALTTGNHHSNQSIGKIHSNGNSNQVINAYFVLRVGNMNGTSGTVFESAPDGFAKSQSWGYRSRSMMGEEYLGISSNEIDDQIEKSTNHLNSTNQIIKSIGKYSVLRCTVVIGVT